MENFQLQCDLKNSELSKEAIIKLLPQWPTKVLSVQKRDVNGEVHHELKLEVALLTTEDIKSWLKEYQEQCDCRYYIRSTESRTGRRVLFKQRLCCHRSLFRASKKGDASMHHKRKNTNCPSSIIVTLRAVKKRYKGKDPEKAPDPKMPCEILLVPTHNHSIHSVEDLRFRKVSTEVHDKLLELYHKGHTPNTALRTLKMDIQSTHENFEKILADRRFCPSYDYCYRLYKTEFEDRYKDIEFNDEGKDVLIDRLNKYNSETGGNSAGILVHESDHIICICSPLMRRVHETVQSASEMVFLDSFGTAEKDGSRIYIMLTDSECDALPLGVIVTTSESVDVISLGFQLLKNMLGEQIFGGCVDGPTIFLTNDCAAAEAAFQSVWGNSTSLLSIFHVLRTVWKWLVENKNGIEQSDQQKFFQDFKSILYANSLEQCEELYNDALSDASRYPNYSKYLQGFWDRRKVWALCYRSNLLGRDNHTNIYSEAAMRLLREKVFDGTKTFRLIQMVDFLLTKFVGFYERRLLDAAHHRSRNKVFHKVIKVPPEGLLERILVLSDEIILVPSDARTNLFFMLNKDILMCSCIGGRSGKFCEHIDWACFFSYCDEYFESSSSESIRRKFYHIATGKQATSSSLRPTYKKERETVDFSNDNVPIPSTSQSESSSPFHTDSEDVFIPVASEQLILKGKSLIEEVSQQYLELLNKSYLDLLHRSPEQAVDELQMLKDNMGKMKTLSPFVPQCSSCSQDDYNNVRSQFPIQPSEISRRRDQIREKHNRLGGHPHKNQRLIEKLSQSLGII